MHVPFDGHKASPGSADTRIVGCFSQVAPASPARAGYLRGPRTGRASPTYRGAVAMPGAIGHHRPATCWKQPAGYDNLKRATKKAVAWALFQG